MTTILGSQVFIGFIYLVASALFILASAPSRSGAWTMSFAIMGS